MFLGCKILILPKSNHFCPNFAQFHPNLPKSNQICPKNFARRAVASSASPVLTALQYIVFFCDTEKRKNEWKQHGMTCLIVGGFLFILVIIGIIFAAIGGNSVSMFNDD